MLSKTHEDASPKFEQATTTANGTSQSEANVLRAGDTGLTLTLLGQIRDNYVVFQFENKAQAID